MGFLGLVVQAIACIFLIYSGYFYQDASREMILAMIFGTPILFMIGTAIKHNDRSSSSPRGFIDGIKALVGMYLAFVVVSLVMFGIGVGLYYVLVLRPAEGVGRYD